MHTDKQTGRQAYRQSARGRQIDRVLDNRWMDGRTDRQIDRYVFDVQSSAEVSFPVTCTRSPQGDQILS